MGRAGMEKIMEVPEGTKSGSDNNLRSQNFMRGRRGSGE